MRKIITSLFLILIVAAFAVFTVFVLLYAQGKTFDGTTGIVQTGIIRVNSNPKDVSTYINGEERTLIESKVDALEPGTVSVTLRKDGYYDWTKEVVVEAGVLKDIFAQMIPRTIELTDVSTDDIVMFVPSNINEFIYYISNDADKYTLRKIKVRRDFLDFSDSAPTTVKILETDEYSLLSSSQNLSVSSDNARLLFTNNALSTTGIVDLNNGEISYITSDLPTKLNKDISWFKSSESLLVTTENNLNYEYNINSGVSIIVANDPVGIYKSIGFAVFKTTEGVYLYENERITPLTNNSQLALLGLNSTSITLNQINPQIFGLQDEAKKISFFDLDKNLSLSSNTSGDIVYASADATHYIIDTGAGIVSVSFEFSIASRQYKLTTGALTRSDISDEDILDYKFYNNNKNILYSTETQIFTSDLDGANFREISIPEGYDVLEANITSDNQFIYTILKDTDTDLIKVYKINIVLK